MADVVANLIGIIILLAVIAFSIAFHEWGHFVTARRFGAKVTEFMVGFGPVLWARVRGETSYGLKAVPLGGYVRIVGMLPPPPEAPANVVPASSTGRFASLIEQARADSMVEIEPGDEDRVFYKLAARKRVVVMMAGPFMNLILATVLFTGVLVGIGLPQATSTIDAVIPCVPTAERPLGAVEESGSCAAGSRPSPASAADIQPGDVVLSVNSTTVGTWADLYDTLGGVPPGSEAALVLDRDGTRITTTLVTVEATFPVVDDSGQPTGQTQTRPFIGIRPDAAYVPLPVSEVPGYMWDLSVRSAKALLTLPARVVELAQTLATDGERDPNGPVSVVGVTRIGGEIAALDEPIKAKAAAFLGLAASLNLFLFLFNLVPLPPLDGGHAATAIYDGVRRHVARWRGRADPGPFDTARLLPVTYGIASLLIVSGIIVIWADVVKPITLNG